jgi:hypothetical protein
MLLDEARAITANSGLRAVEQGASQAKLGQRRPDHASMNRQGRQHER